MKINWSTKPTDQLREFDVINQVNEMEQHAFSSSWNCFKDKCLLFEKVAESVSDALFAECSSFLLTRLETSLSLESSLLFRSQLFSVLAQKQLQNFADYLIENTFLVLLCVQTFWCDMKSFSVIDCQKYTICCYTSFESKTIQWIEKSS